MIIYRRSLENENANAWKLSSVLAIHGRFPKRCSLILKNTFAPFIMQKNKTVNPERAEVFTEKHTNENKIIDLSILPLREWTLLLHIKRANYVAKL